jgi:hypothetical protein
MGSNLTTEEKANLICPTHSLKDMWVSRAIGLFGIRRACVVSFTLCSPYPHKKISRHSFFWRLGGLQRQSICLGVEENLLPLTELRLVIQSLSPYCSQYCQYAVSVPRPRASTHFCTTASAGCSKLRSVCGRFDNLTYTCSSRMALTTFTSFYY